MKRWIAVALCSLAALAHAEGSQTKKELVARLLQLQQPGIEMMAKMVAERPVIQLMQQAGAALQQVPADKREATAKSLQADAQKYIDEAAPVVREHAVKMAPSTIGPALEEKFSESELKQLIAWHQSPLKKKYDQVGGEVQGAMMKKLVSEISPVLDSKLQALQKKMGDTLRSALGQAAPAAPAKPASK